MTPLSASDFPAFFRELWGHDPFPWQSRLADQVVSMGAWPAGMALPTASGKTALIDIAVFALAVVLDAKASPRAAPRRIVFVVNRRVIVDEAYERARDIAEKLKKAAAGTILHRVAQALRSGCATPERADPLACHLLRGGVFRDAAWCEDSTQPAVICSTVDQVGSRVLFRGYGVSEHSRPIEAAMLGEDALWLVDEAHVSRPFVQTLREVEKYRRSGWVERPLTLPWHLVELTATPSDTTSPPFALDSADFSHPILSARRNAPKPVTLLPADNKRPPEETLGEAALALFKKLNSSDQLSGRASVVVFVNRVKTARAVFAHLKKSADTPAVELVIGRMRGADRDELNKRLKGYGLKTGAAATLRKPVIVVSTQCLECGADLDFDGLVTECAALDALRQRFGRLNRAGRDIPAEAVLLLPVESKEPDFLYGEALTKTAAWLASVAKKTPPDFGLATLETALAGLDRTPLNTPTLDAPVLLPPILDSWVQTSPAPTLDPDIAPFLHGPARERPEVRVLWRAGLSDSTADALIGAIPPVASESVAVPLHEMERFLRGEPAGADCGDLEQLAAPLPGETNSSPTNARQTRRAYIFREEKWGPAKDAPLRPGDLIVLPVETGGWSMLAHAPLAPGDPAVVKDSVSDLVPMDIAEVAALRARDTLSLRLGLNLPLADLASTEATHLRVSLTGDDFRARDIREAVAVWIDAARQQLVGDTARQQLAEALAKVDAKSAKAEIIEGTDSVLLHWPRRLHLRADTEETSGRTGRQSASAPITLETHQKAVGAEARRLARAVGISAELETTVGLGGDHHDEGKRDPRFQAMLRGGDREAARLAPAILAKSPKIPASAELRRAISERAALPGGFRHELLSVRLVEQALATCALTSPDDELLLHLIGAHHGRCRPLAPEVTDLENPTVTAPLAGLSVTASAATGLARYDSGVLRRFVTLNRRYGRWGLAYLEALLRLADRRVSAAE